MEKVLIHPIFGVMESLSLIEFLVKSKAVSKSLATPFLNRSGISLVKSEAESLV